MSDAPVAEVAASGPEHAPPSRARRTALWLRSTHPVVVTVLAFVASIIVGGVLIFITDTPTRKASKYFFSSPGDTFSRGWHAVSQAYVALFEGSIFDPHTAFHGSFWQALNPLSETLLNATPLILAGLAVGLAFRAGLFNIGAQGQLIIGAVFAGYVGFAWHLPIVLHVIVALIAGIIGGALWAGIAGWLKARTGAHEVITTIMLNYVALYFLNYLLGVSGFQKPKSNEAVSKPISGNARLPHLFGSNLPVHLDLLIALAAAAGVMWLLSRSTLGFSLRAIGANQHAARTAGMNVERGYVIVMLISGALAGLV